MKIANSNGLRKMAFGAIGAFGLVISSGAAQAQNLADALIGAYNTSGLLEQNRALLRAADEDAAIALAALRPIISWTAGINRSFSDTSNAGRAGTSPVDLGLTASWLLYDGGQSQLAVRGARETVLATRESLRSVEQSILLRAVAAYMNVISAVETVDLRENNVRVLSEERRAAQDRFDVGEVTGTDVAQAESRLAEARSNLAQAQGDLTNAQEEYLAAVGSRPGNLANPPALPPEPASVDAAKSVALRNHPDILSAQREVTVAELGVQEADAARNPTISLNGSVGWQENFDTSGYGDSASLGLNLSQPIYSGGGLFAAVRRAMAARDATRAALLTTQEDIAQDAASAYIQLKTAEATLTATEQQIEAVQVAFDGVREEATLGARTTLDVLDAEQNLLDAQASRISAQTTRQIAAYALLQAQGLLTADQLGLNVTLYDPEAYYNLVQDAPAEISKRGQDLDRVLRAIGKQGALQL